MCHDIDKMSGINLKNLCNIGILIIFHTGLGLSGGTASAENNAESTSSSTNVAQEAIEASLDSTQAQSRSHLQDSLLNS